jgi:hypothetical protein
VATNPVDTACTVVELRRYALHRGARETLIELFEREFVETQEAVGIRVLGTFRDVDDPDSFVWLRGFANMSARAVGLRAFYEGPVWAEHRSAAAATMIDSDNVLLLRPLNKASQLAMNRRQRPPTSAATGFASITICPLQSARVDAFRDIFDREIAPALDRTGANVRATFVTDHSFNNYPRLPVREAEVFVWLSLFADEEAQVEHAARLDLRTTPTEHLADDIETIRLEPTARSLLPD